MTKKILIIMSALFIGGAEKQYRYIIDTLSKQYRVYVLLLNQPIEGEKENTDFYINQHSNTIFYQLNGNALNYAKKGKLFGTIGKVQSLWIQWRWLRKFLTENDIDAVMFTYVTQLLMVPLFNRNKVAVVFNERNTGRQICDKRFKRKLLKECDAVISNSEYAAEYIHERTGINVEVYRNGIEIKPCTKKEHLGFNILVPARISKIKNQMIVVKALEQLDNYLSEKEKETINCFLAGIAEHEEYKNEIVNEINIHKLNVRLLGYVENMEELYSSTDLIILPSFEEGTPNVLLEGYMNQIDVLVSDIPMNRVCCTDGNMLFSPDDDDDLAHKIANCYRIRKTQDFYNMNYQYVTENYSIDSMEKNYTDLFKRLLDISERRI